MANDNNEINELVSIPDDDPTAEFEIPILYADPEQIAADDAEDGGEFGQQSIAVLRSNLISSTEHIEQLQSEIEKVRTHAQELELEIESFGEGAPDRQVDVDEWRSRLRTTEKDLDSRDQTIAKLESDLQEANQAAAKSSDDTEQFRRAAKSDRSSIRRLEKRLRSRDKKLESTAKKLEKSLSDRHLQDVPDARIAELESQLAQAQVSLDETREHVTRRMNLWSQLEDEFAQANANLQTAQYENEKLSMQIDEDNERLSRRRIEVEELTGQLTARIDECDRLRIDNREIRLALHGGSDSEMERNQELVAKQSGLISGYAQEIRQLMTRIGSTEEYANDLRQKLQVQAEISDRTDHAKQRLQANLKVAEDNIDHLTEALAAAERLAADLEGAAQQRQLDYGEETQRLQAELESAQEIIGGQATTNEQLLSDLYDNKGFRQALELQLSETEEKSDKQVRHLEQQANRLRNQVDDYQRKLQNKDDAITALMNELANRSAKIESINEIEDAIQEIDYHESARNGDQEQFDRERVTRLLVGSNDGQELRFPLFKNRLTIGRTAHNDIQLNAQFISRRHAVIVTESSGTRIVDWGSKNGIFINDKRVAEQILKNGDIVTIGATEFRYEERPKR